MSTAARGLVEPERETQRLRVRRGLPWLLADATRHSPLRSTDLGRRGASGIDRPKPPNASSIISWASLISRR